MRRSGKTFRALLSALAQTSEGHDVIYECDNMKMANWTFEKALVIVSGFMDPSSPERNMIKLGTGTLRFTSKLSEQQLMLVSSKSRSPKIIHDLTDDFPLQLNTKGN